MNTMDDFDIFNAIYQTDFLNMNTLWDIRIDIALFINYPWRPSSTSSVISAMPHFFQSFSISVNCFTLVFPLQAHHYSSMAI